MKKPKPTGNSPGYFITSRKAIIGQPFTPKTHAFIELLGKAAYKVHWEHDEHRKKIAVYRGEVFASKTALAKRFRVTRVTIQKWLDQWQKEGLITMRRPSRSRNSANTVIKITYYDNGGYPPSIEDGGYTPDSGCKVANSNGLDSPEKLKYTPETTKYTPEQGKGYTPDSSSKPNDDKGLGGVCPF